MLESKSSTDTVRAWLHAAVGDDKGVKARLAARCGVTPQAVSGWLKSGRITKRNLEIAADFFGHGPRFSNHVTLRQPAPRYSASGWPFARLSLDAINQLPQDDLLRLESAWLAAAAAVGIVVTKRRAA